MKQVGITVGSALLALTLVSLLLVIVAAEAVDNDLLKGEEQTFPGQHKVIPRRTEESTGMIVTNKVAAQTSLSPSLLVDDFHDITPTNELGKPSGWTAYDGASITCSYTGGMLCCDYDDVNPGSFASYWTDLNMSLAGFNSLSFQVSGTVEGEVAFAELKDCVPEYPKLRIKDYTSEPITASWQQVDMPLVGFTQVADWSCIDKFDLVLHNAGGDGQGTICLDNVWLEPRWVPVVVDRFDDCQEPNALNGQTSAFVGGKGKIGYGYTDSIRTGDMGCAQWITYAVPSDSYAVWQTELKGLDVSEYHALMLLIKGSQGGEEPNVWLQDGTISSTRAYKNVEVTATVADDAWQRIVIPLEFFSTQRVSLANLSTFQLGFEWAEMTGTVYVDDIQFIPYTIYLPLVLRRWPPWWEQEPNDDALTQANGPIVSGQTYYGTLSSASDVKDYFYFDLSTPHTVEIWLTNIPAGHDYHLCLRDANLVPEIKCSANSGNADEHILVSGLTAGERYYVQVYNASRTGSSQPYHLRTVYQ
jgi:hypothetical protein